MKKSFIVALAVLVMFAFTSPLFANGEGEQAAELSKPMVLRLGHVAATSEPYHVAAEKFAELVKAKTNSMITVEIFPNSQLGSSRDLIEGLQMGTVDATLTTAAVLANFIPTSQVIELPFMFRDRQHVYDVVDGPLATEIFKGDTDKKLKVINTWENGFRQITNNVREIKTPEDMSGIKIRVMENQMYIDMFNALGANPTPMARSELFTALQQKTVDAQENPMGQIYSSRFYEVQKYLTLTGHTYSPEVLVFSLKTWDKMPAKYQALVTEAANEARDYCRELKEAKDKEYIEAVKKEGMVVTTVAPAAVAAFQEKMKPVWAKYYDVIGKDLIDKVYNTK